MINKKSYMGKRSFVSDFVNLYAANGGVRSVIDTTDWVVDNLSYALGQQFVLTGDIVIRKREIDGRMCVYLVLTTKCGRELSLMVLMGVSSLKGYDLENILEVEYIGSNGDKATRYVQSELINNFNFAEAWQPPTRNYLELAAMIAEKEVDLTGATVTYLGTIYKPFIAKRSGEQFAEKFKQGFKRIIRTRLWAVKMSK